MAIMGFTSIDLHTTGHVIDIAGNEYKTIIIGEQEWMAENLRVSQFRNGDPVPIATTMDEWKEACSMSTPMAIHYDFNQGNGMKYGLIYNQAAIEDSKGLAPEGWHVSTSGDWQKLLQPFKPTSNQNRSFKSSKELKSESGWTGKRGSNGTGFSSIPSGRISGDEPKFSGLNDETACYYGGHMYTEEKKPDIILIENSYNGVNLFLSQPNQGYSVRCLKDN